MASSTRQAIACTLLLFAIVIDARSQNEKRSAATFSGKVTINGKAAPGIAVGLIRIEDSKYHSSGPRTTTNEQGNYKLTNVGPGTYQLMVAAPGFVAAPESFTEKTFLITKSETLENINFDLVRGGVITGRVTDSDGHPLIEEDIALFSEDRGGYFQRTVKTDDRGIYRLFAVPPGKYKVAAGRDDANSFSSRGGGNRRTFHPDTTEVSQAKIIEVTEGGEATNVDIKLPDPTVNYSAQGRIINGDTGQPLANVSYGVERFINESYTSSISNGALSNKDGEFKLDNLPPGKYAVFVEVPPDSDWRADYVRFEVVDRDVTGLTVKTSRGASVSGVIVLEGTDDKTVLEQLRKARIYAQVSSPDSTRTSSPSGTINQDGSFRIAGLQAGTLNFAIGVQRFRIMRVELAGLAQPQGIELKERDQITGLRLITQYANGGIQGVVKLDEGSIPAKGRVAVSYTRLGDPDPRFANRHESAQVDAVGRFFVEGLLPGTYEVTAAYALDERTAWRRVTQQVIVTSGAVANVTLTIDTH